MNPSLQEIIIGILQDYYESFNVESVEANYVITDDIAGEYAKLRPDHAAIDPLKIQELKDYNGNMVCPYEVGERFTVLINKNKLIEYASVGNMTWVGTIVHETTHVRDYKDYASLIGASDYEDILDSEKNIPFKLWTEFNARAKGYFFVRKYSFQNMYDPSQIYGIVNKELPIQKNLLYQNYHRTNDSYQQAYYVSHYLGRLYCLQKIFPDFFTNNWISQMDLCVKNSWMREWFWFLKDNDTLQKAFPKFEEMNNILMRNTSLE